MGAEITKRMELGILTKSVCNTILQLTRTSNPVLHHSFGDKTNMELPHIMGPLWSVLDRLNITSING